MPTSKTGATWETFIVLVVLTFLIVDIPKAHALFGHTAEERQRRIATEKQLSQEQQRLDVQQHLTVEQQQRASHWQTIAWVFGVVAVFTFIIGLVLHEMDGCLAMLARIAWKLILLSTLATAAVMATKHFPSSSKGSSRRRK